MGTCDKCYQIKLVGHKPYLAVRSLKASGRFCTGFMIDFIRDIFSSEFHGVIYSFIFLVICCYTKFAQYNLARIN